MSSREYLHRQAVNVLTMFPAKASNASIQELQAIPANIRSPDKALFWNITCPIPRAMINLSLIHIFYAFGEFFFFSP